MDKEAFKEYLSEGFRNKYSENTIKNYVKFASLCVGSSDNAGAIRACRTHLERMIGQGVSIGTLSPYRAACSLFLASIGHPLSAIEEALPSLSGARKSNIRDALNSEDLREYTEKAESVKSLVVSTILLLLPKSGLRISEMCNLKYSNIRVIDGKYRLYIEKAKGDKKRVVPLGKSGTEILKKYVDSIKSNKDSDDYLFPGKADKTPIGAGTIRKVTRGLGIEDLSPHVLRHTYATSLLREGVALKDLQTILGHEDLKTTQRYLHPTEDDLSMSINKTSM